MRFETSDHGTFGRLGRWFTLELPWRDNQSSISCLPEGDYPVFWGPSPRLRRSTYRLAKTAPRAGILIHSASLAGDSAKGLKCQLNGCIALGEKIGWIDGQKALLVSRPAVSRFEAESPKTFILEIRNA